MSSTSLLEPEWLRTLSQSQPRVAELLGKSPEQQRHLGYFHTLREICQQPSTCERTFALTCNQEGSLARTYAHDPRVGVIVLDERTNDRGLVMTSSFTNLVLAARFLGLREEPARYQAICEQLVEIASVFMRDYLGKLATVARAPFDRAVYLGDDSRFAAAREAALKMLEMPCRRVTTMCEIYFCLRHGPMS